MEILCKLFGRTRQAYYDNKRVVYAKNQRNKLIIEWVKIYRLRAPRIGGVKLYDIISGILGKEITGGRDAFLHLLSENKLMLPRNKPRYTTDSRHPYHKYANIVSGINLLYPNQVWYADITYVWIKGDVLYLHLITDGFSHAIIGWCLSDSLEAVNTVEALKMAIEAAGGGNLCGTIHHSDRGSQYASQLYVSLLMEHHIRISMTETYNPTDNAIAERVNGILKDEWIYRTTLFEDYDQARYEIAKMIDFYNYERPHMSIGMQRPMNVYNGEKPGSNLWNKKI